MKYVYRIFAPSGDLLYVGKTSNPDRRLTEHKWAPPGCTARVDGPYDDIDAILLERRAIITEHPERNKQWSGKGDEPTLASFQCLSTTDAAAYLTGASVATSRLYGPSILRGLGVAVDDETGTCSLIDLEAKAVSATAEHAEASAS